MNTRVRAAPEALDAMRDHLARAYPDEGCGILIGKEADDGCVEISRAVGARNANTARASDRFEIDPRDLLAVERELAKQSNGTRITGFFHSHPDAPAQPSRTDLEMAQGVFEAVREFYVYAIVSVNRGRPDAASFWRLAEDKTQFIQL